MKSLPKWIAIGASFGATCALVLWGAYQVSIWYQAQPRTWDTKSIEATFHGVEAMGNRWVVVEYVLHNRSAVAYRIFSTEQPDFMTRLKDPPVLRLNHFSSPPPGSGRLVVLQDVPLFIPAGESGSFRLQLAIDFGDAMTSGYWWSRYPSLLDHLRESGKSHSSTPPTVPRQAAPEGSKAGHTPPTVTLPPDVTKSDLRTSARHVKGESLAKEHFENIDGFVLFDKANWYRIDLPRGW